MTNTSNPMPAFGDFVNVGIQFMKTERASKIIVSSQVFENYIIDNLKLSTEAKSLYYKIYSKGGKLYCYEYLISLLKEIFNAMELINNTYLPLRTKYNEKPIKQKFKDINETITVELFKKLDPNNLTILNLFCNEIALSDREKNSNLTILFYRTVFLKDLRHVHEISYPNKPDPLLTHIINQCQAMFDYITNGSPLINPLKKAIKSEENDDLRKQLVNNIQGLGRLTGSIEKNKNRALRNLLQDKIDNLTPEQFEKFSVNLLAHVLRAERPNTEINIEHTGKTADGGIDGKIVIKNTLSEEVHIIQCKRYAKTVPVANVREFMGILKKYKHGYFITNSDFTKGCYDHEQEEANLTLINGDKMIDYMINHRYGVKEIEVKPIFKIDESCFN